MKTVGVIGLGSIGARHASNLQGLGCKVLGTDVAPKLYAGCEMVTLSDLLRRSDAIVVASPTLRHAEHIRAALSTGKPVFAEKPIAAEYDGAFKDVAFVGYNLRFHCCVKQAREWINDIGVVLWATFTCAQFNRKPAYLRDGVILNWSHEIDLALHLLGPGTVEAASARITDGAEDIADILITHDTGARSTVHLDYVTQPEVRQSMIVGTEASIIMDLINRQAWLRDTRGAVIDHIAADDSFDDNYVEEMQAFLDMIDGERMVGATGADGLAALRVCLHALFKVGLR